MITVLAFTLLVLLATILPVTIVGIIRTHRAIVGHLAPIIGREPGTGEP